MAEFTLHPRLEDSSVFVCDLDLCQVRLNFDGDLDWLLLIPKRAGLEELIDLDDKDQAQLVKEVNFVSRVLKDEVRPDKINVASLGNQVLRMIGPGLERPLAIHPSMNLTSRGPSSGSRN